MDPKRRRRRRLVIAIIIIIIIIIISRRFWWLSLTQFTQSANTSISTYYNGRLHKDLRTRWWLAPPHSGGTSTYLPTTSS